MKNITIILPCYNEEESIPFLLEQIKLFNSNIKFILLDNGSSDNTQTLLKKITIPKNVTLLLKQKNNGYGAGLKFGYQYVKSEYVGWMHTDLQQQIKSLEKASNLLNTGITNDKKFIAVKGLRTKRSIMDLFFTISLSFFTSCLFLRPCWDIAGQPNIYRKKDIKFIKEAPDDHRFEFYIFLKFLIMGGNYQRFEAPFLERKFGKSSWDDGLKSKLKHSWVIFKYIIKLRFIAS
jgi:glycosyltransferase involved in cell wall biosynthesis